MSRAESPDEGGSNPKATVARRYSETGLGTDRYINVNDGEKRSYDHDTRYDDPRDVPGRNYAIYSGAGVVDIDIDDYGEGTDDTGLNAIRDLPDTLTAKTPHTDGDRGGHLFYHVVADRSVDDFDVDAVLARYIEDDGEKKQTYHAAKNDPVALTVADEFGGVNLAPSWGEVRVANQYVVGPGSRIKKGEDGCDKDWCEDCPPVGDDGYYTIAKDEPIATITAEELIQALRVDPGLDDDDDTDIEYTPKNGSDESHARKVAEHYSNIQDYLRFGSDDRSEQDFHVCCRMIEHGVDEREVCRLLANNSNSKVDASDAASDYWNRTWKRAKQKVGSDANTEALNAGSVTSSDTPTAATRDSGLPIPSAFDEHNGGYAKYHPSRDDEGDGYYERITNFQIETLSRLTHDDGTREYHIRVHPADGESYDVTCEPVVFNDLRKFRREVLDGWTTTFDGSQDDLNRLKEFIGRQDAKNRTGTKLLGLHCDEWVTPDGSLTATGWSDNPNTVFTDVETPLATAFDLDPSQGSEYDGKTVQEILRLLPQTRTAERFLPVIGWFYAAPFRPYIQQWGGEFNLLNVLGDTGSGKTTTLETLWQAFGVDEELPEAKATPFSIMRMIASSNAVPLILDEYKPAEIRDYKLNELHSNLRESTRGGVVTKGRADMGVDRYHLKAPVCVSGEQPIQGPAEERRTILTVFKRDVTVGETAEQEAHARLVGGEANGEWFDGYDLTDHALAYYQWVLQQDTDELYGLWKEARAHVIDLLEGTGYTGLDDMVIQGFQTIKFGCTLYRAFADEMGLNPDDTPVTSGAIDQAIHYVADGGTGAKHTSHLDRLLGIMSRAASAGYLGENEHYKIVNQGEPNAELAIHLDTAFDKVRKYARDHDVRGDDLLSSAGDYKARIEDAADDPESYVTAYGQNTPPLNRCVRIHIGDATDLVDGFEPEPFGVSGESDETKSSRFDPVSLHNVAKDPTGYPTVEGEVATVDYPEGDDSPALKATLVDGSTAIDVISWDDSSCLECGEEVIIENAGASEFDGTTQLVVKEGVTKVHEAPENGQRQIDETHGAVE